MPRLYALVPFLIPHEQTTRHRRYIDVVALAARVAIHREAVILADRREAIGGKRDARSIVIPPRAVELNPRAAVRLRRRDGLDRARAGAGAFGRSGRRPDGQWGNAGRAADAISFGDDWRFARTDWRRLGFAAERRRPHLEVALDGERRHPAADGSGELAGAAS